MKLLLWIGAVIITTASHAQTNTTKLVLVGDVKDSATGEPLAYATISTKNHLDQAVSRADGKFELTIPATAHNDTLVVTYVGYERFQKPIQQLASFENISLKEYATVLNEISVLHRQIDLRDIDRTVRIIRGNLYAIDHEVTNIEYNNFLSWLEDYNKLELKKKHDFDLTGYEKSVQDFFRRYHKPSSEKDVRHRHSKDSITNYNRFPAINISYESAVEYCEWLTTLYNESQKKKRFKKVVFRLPTLKEWQIAALGDPKFQSWELRENVVEVIISKDTIEIFKGTKKKMKVDDTILYPWYFVYHMRNRTYNQFGCYLGNFKTTVYRNCPNRWYAHDGWTLMARTSSYFPNNIGLYDVVGNVAEMIDEKGKACGGSWNEPPQQGTIQSVKTFSGPDETVGFRVFMEVIEP